MKSPLRTLLLLLLAGFAAPTQAADETRDAFEEAFSTQCQQRGTPELCDCLLEAVLERQTVDAVIERGLEPSIYAQAHRRCSSRPSAAPQPEEVAETGEVAEPAEVAAPSSATSLSAAAEPLRAALLAGSPEAWVEAAAPLRVLERAEDGSESEGVTLEAGAPLPEPLRARLLGLADALNEAPGRWSEDAEVRRVRIEGTATSGGVELRFVEAEGGALELDALVTLPISAPPQP